MLQGMNREQEHPFALGNYTGNYVTTVLLLTKLKRLICLCCTQGSCLPRPVDCEQQNTQTVHQAKLHMTAVPTQVAAYHFITILPMSRP